VALLEATSGKFKFYLFPLDKLAHPTLAPVKVFRLILASVILFSSVSNVCAITGRGDISFISVPKGGEYVKNLSYKH